MADNLALRFAIYGFSCRLFSLQNLLLNRKFKLQYLRRIVMKKYALTLALFAFLSLPAQASLVGEQDEYIARGLELVKNNPVETKSVSDFTMAPYYEALLLSSLNFNKPEYLAEFINKGNQAGWKLGVNRYDSRDYAVAGAWAKFQRLSNDKGLLNFAKRDMLKIADFQKSDTENRAAWNSAEKVYGGAFAFANMYAATGDKRLLEYMNFRLKQFFDSNADLSSAKAGIADTALVLRALSAVLENSPKDWAERAYYEGLFVKNAERAKTFSAEDFAKFKDTSERIANLAFVTGALAWGVNNKVLKADDYRLAIEKDFAYLCSHKKELSDTQSFSEGAFIYAENQVSVMSGKRACKGDLKELLAKAKEILLDKSSKASFAKLEPRRADDIAWENDKTAYRAYGPALEKSIENGGFDIWGKTVSYPVIQKWYDEDLSKIRSYHEDHGEGMDSYKVADSAGVGGSVVFDNSKILRSNVYKAADVFWTAPDRAKLALNHQYKLSDGTVITEFKTLNIKSGDNFFTVDSKICDGAIFDAVCPPKENCKFSKKNLQLGIGVLTQSPDAKIEIAPDNSYVIVYDKMAGKLLIQFIQLASGTKIVGSKVSDFDGKLKEVFIIVKPDDNGQYSYRAGYIFEGREPDLAKRDLKLEPFVK